MTPALLTNVRVQRVVKALPHLVGGQQGDRLGDWQPDDLDELLRDYFRVMQIAHFVRRGGVKAMLYRLETGKTKWSPGDFLDEANGALLAAYQGIYQPQPLDEPSVLELLKNIADDEQQAVERVLPQLDAALMALRRNHMD